MFKDAYFNKPYRTRDGRKAIFYMSTDFGASLLTEKYGLEHYHFDGTIFNCTTENDNIVSEWEEEINEEKLDELANKELSTRLKFASAQHVAEMMKNDFVEGFKRGYRKALERE